MNKNYVTLFFMLIILMTIIGSTNVLSKTITVSTTNDNVSGSLREAITIANTNGEDNIIFLIDGVYKLTGDIEDENNQSGDLDIFTTKKLVITGNNNENTIIDGNGVDRILDIFSGEITLKQLTIRNGKPPSFGNDYYVGRSQGGGICNAAKLTLIDCNLVSNSSGAHGGSAHHGGKGGDGGAIYNSGDLMLLNCLVQNNHTANGQSGGVDGGYGGFGGAIYNSKTGDLVVKSTTFDTNSCGNGGDGESSSKGGFGGAICSYNYLYMSNCTLSSNRSGDGGPGIEFGNGGDGGAIYIGGGSGKLINCTISGNITGNGADSIDIDGAGGFGGGIAVNDGKLEITNCTIVNNSTGEGELSLYNYISTGLGGGIYNKYDGNVSLGNTIVANNLIHANSKGKDIYGTFNSSGYNLIEDMASGVLNGDLSGNLTGVDPLLGLLSDNGGVTPTHALLNGSPAIDKGYSLINYDQRGVSRPKDIAGIENAHLGEDIGAYEYKSQSSQIVSVSPGTLLFCADTAGNHTGDQFISINMADGNYWEVTKEINWLSCSAKHGYGSTEITVSLNPSGLAPGTYVDELEIYADGYPNYSYITVILNVYQSNTSSQPFGSFDTPIANSTIASSVPFTGWVLDDIGVKNIKIYREEKNGLIFIGDGIFVEGARPDILNRFPAYPNNSKAGWGYMMLTNFLPNGGNGSYTFTVIAEDVEGNTVSLGRKTVTIDNAHAVKPFGAIDTPGQGGNAAGTEYVNFAWALTPSPNMIPYDGSTIQVWVDGKSVGNPVYNTYREDIASLFPGYANSDGAGGHFYLDTTQYDNGVHTIAWSVKDNAGNTDGIGSRYFTIGNSEQREQASNVNYSNSKECHSISVPGEKIQRRKVSQSPLEIKTGYNPDVEPKRIYPNNGSFSIDINELEHLEVDLKNSLAQEVDYSKGIWQGYHIIGNRLYQAPIGSSIDSEKGIFYWDPGPGFSNTYNLLFILKEPSGQKHYVTLTININPK